MLYLLFLSLAVAPPLSKIVGEFASIRHGSFISVPDFKRAFSWEELLVERPDLFTVDSTDPVEQLAFDLHATREEAVASFIAHNYNKIDAALAKILRSTNDAVIAAVLVNAYESTDASFVKPITDLIVDYRRARNRRCLLDHLPDVFEDAAVYDKYFTVIDGYKVTPKEDAGFTAVLTNDPTQRLIREQGGALSIRVHIFNGVIWLYAAPNLSAARHVLIDTRSGCGVTVNQPFGFEGFLGLEKWLSIVDGNHRLIWRKDSVEPVRLYASDFRLYADGSRVVASNGLYSLPTDVKIPFVATRLDALVDEDVLLPAGARLKLIMGDNDAIAVLSEGGSSMASRSAGYLQRRLEEEFHSSMEVLEDRLYRVRYEIASVFGLINVLRARLDENSWLMASELRTRFRLSSEEELVQFIVSVVNGHCPLGIALPLPIRFLSKKERMQNVVGESDLRRMVASETFRTSMNAIMEYPLDDLKWFGRRIGIAGVLCLAVAVSLNACHASLNRNGFMDTLSDDINGYISRKLQQTLSIETGSLY